MPLYIMTEKRKIWHWIVLAALSLIWGTSYILMKKGLESLENWFRNLGYIAILAILGSASALALFYLLIRDTSPIFASIVTYFIPIVATAWGIADNEHFTSSMIVSIVFIFAGVYIINRPDFFKRRKPKE